MKMGTFASPWRYDAAASHARAPLKHLIAYDLVLRPRAAIFQCHGRLGWTLIHPGNRVYAGCRRKPGSQISAPSRLLLTLADPRWPSKREPVAHLCRFDPRGPCVTAATGLGF